MANENVTTTTALIGLQGQLDTVRSEVISTNAGLQNIANLIQNDNILDQQKLLEEREQERLLVEREIRTGQEEELQKRVSAAVEQPVQKLETKLTSTFDNITNALKYLFTGFLGVQVLRGLKGAANIGTKALSGIGSLLRNSFNFIGSGLSFLKNGIGGVIQSISGVTNRVSKGIISLAAVPFKGIADIFKRFIPSLGGVGGAALKVAGAGLGGFLAYENIKEGDIIGAGLNTLAAIPSQFSIPAAFASMGYEAFTGGGIKMDKIFPEGFKMPSFPQFDISSMGQNISNFFGINLQAPAPEVKGNVEKGNATTPSQTPSSPIKLETVPFTPQPSSQKPTIPPTPEAKPDVVYLKTGEQQQQQSVVPIESGSITDVPLIPSSNPDNFYTLYAQINYNVVM